MPQPRPSSPNSSVAGYLQPGLYTQDFTVTDQVWENWAWDLEPTIDGQDLDNFFEQFVAGITNLDPNFVIPRYQPEPPNFSANTTWAAVGVVENDLEPGLAYSYHDGSTSPGRDYVQQHEVFTLLVSFYGDNADYAESALRDGLQVSQNRELLQLTAMGLVEIGTKTVVPRLINQRWRRRIDRRYRFRRMIRQVYPILNIKSVPFSATTDDGVTVSGTVVAPSTL